MAKRSLVDRLDRIIAATLTAERGAGLATVDRRLGPLARVAADLRDLPRPSFKQRLKNDLERRASMSAPAVNPIRAGFHTITPYVTVPQAAEMIEFVSSAFGAQEVFRDTGYDDRRGQRIPRHAHSHYVPILRSECGPGLCARHRGRRYRTVGASRRPWRPVRGGRRSVWERLDYRHAPGAKVYTGRSARRDHLFAPGRGAKFIGFLKEAFEAEEFVRYDSPDGDVLHAKIRIGDSIVELGDSRRHSSGMVLPSMPTGIYMYVADADAVYRRAISAGAVSLSEPADQPYGDRLAGVQDFCGNRWYIATHIRGGAS
jgi:PhnB protein